MQVIWCINAKMLLDMAFAFLDANALSFYLISNKLFIVLYKKSITLNYF